jgi:cytidyltransferase-like protein
MSQSVVVSGGFDPIHIGHLKMFQEASKLAPRLIVIVNNDNFLMQKKGYVFMPIEERLAIIKEFSVVDVVIESIDQDLTVCKTLESIAERENIKYFANGGDRKNINQIPEASVCDNNNIEMIFNSGGGKIQSSSSLVSKEVIKPWGSYKTFEKNTGYLLKKITVNPGEILSLQSHQHRSEYWHIIKGIATVEIEDKITSLSEHQSAFIPKQTKHRVSNEEDEVLVFFEIQSGDHLSEDDITRYEDKYNRS